jgi:hypothetical protein
MTSIRSRRTPTVRRRWRSRRCAALATTLALGAALAPAVAAPASSARTFGFSHRTLVQNPLPSDWNCLYQRAVANQQVACH